jgi:hypothetical protein
MKQLPATEAIKGSFFYHGGHRGHREIENREAKGRSEKEIQVSIYGFYFQFPLSVYSSVLSVSSVVKVF